MMKNSGENIRERAYVFALNLVKLTRKFPQNSEGRTIANQLIRSATSVPANLFEGSAGVSKRDFIQFISIAKKSAVETKFWINFSSDLDFLTKDEYDKFSQECEEIVRILSQIILNAKK
jgi:four helix bundle protein